MSDCGGDPNCPECKKQRENYARQAEAKPATLALLRRLDKMARVSHAYGASPETIRQRMEQEVKEFASVEEAQEYARQQGAKASPKLLPPPPLGARVGEYLVGQDAVVYRVVRATTEESPGLVEVAPPPPRPQPKGPKRPPKGTPPRLRPWRLLPGTKPQDTPPEGL